MNKDLLEYIKNKNCFKLILGANNQDIVSVNEIVKIYFDAGCRFFDISANKEIYNSVKNILNKNCFICMSIGVDNDVHFSKCKIDIQKCKKCKKCFNVCIQNAINSNFAIQEEKCTGCKKCFETCPNNAIFTYQKQQILDFDLLRLADCVEFHISTKNTDEIFSKWKILSENYKGIISICLSRKYFSDCLLIELLEKMLKIRSDNIIIQADGNPMSGGENDCKTTLQALACADLINKNFKNIPIFLSGGTNTQTYKLAKMFGIDIAGVSIGSYARKIIQKQNTYEDKLKAAKELLESVKDV